VTHTIPGITPIGRLQSRGNRQTEARSEPLPKDVLIEEIKRIRSEELSLLTRTWMPHAIRWRSAEPLARPRWETRFQS
jgi:hypothetical protein